jgi:hypothetical protein
MTTRRCVTFNVNQFNPLKHQQADLLERMTDADVVFLQETVKFDLDSFVVNPKVIRKAGKWGSFQVREDSNDCRANTAVIYRLGQGDVTDTQCVFIGHANDTRRRFLSAVEFDNWEWDGSFHVFPRRDSREIHAELVAVGSWVKSKGDVPITLGLDKNQATVASLEKATGLKWHGIDIDGFLTNQKLSKPVEFKAGFSDHPGVAATATVEDKPAKPRHTKPREVPPPSPPYLGPAAHTSAGENKPISRIVIHSTVSPCKPGGAQDIARYFRSEAAGGSAHYVVDPGTVVQVVYDSKIAWHAPPNPHSLGIEMCDIPGPVPGDGRVKAIVKAAKRTWRWQRPEQQQMLRRTAKLTAQLCAAYHVPPSFIGPRGLKAGKNGVTTHNNVSQTWHESTHWDPGFWPKRKFMRMVRVEYRRLTK